MTRANKCSTCINAIPHQELHRLLSVARTNHSAYSDTLFSWRRLLCDITLVPLPFDLAARSGDGGIKVLNLWMDGKLVVAALIAAIRTFRFGHIKRPAQECKYINNLSALVYFDVDPFWVKEVIHSCCQALFQLNINRHRNESSKLFAWANSERNP